MTELATQDPAAENSPGRGKSLGSKKGHGNRRSGEFTATVRRTLRRWTDIFFWRTPKTKGTHPVTGKENCLKACFLCVTIPGGNEILDGKWFKRKVIGQLMKWLEYNYSVSAYVGGVEKQETGSNKGQLHAHIFIDRYIPIQDLVEYLKAMYDRLGLLDDMRRRGVQYTGQGIDIRGIYSEGLLEWYLEKYLFKAGQKEGGLTSNWHFASMWIKRSKLPTVDQTSAGAALVAEARKSPDYYFTDAYLTGSGGKILYGEEGKQSPGSKLMMTVIRANYNKKTKKRADLKLLLCRNQLHQLQQFISAYRRSDWEWTETAAMDIEGHIMKKEQLEKHFLPCQLPREPYPASPDRPDSASKRWNDYVQKSKLAARTTRKRRPPKSPPELPFQ